MEAKIYKALAEAAATEIINLQGELEMAEDAITNCVNEFNKLHEGNIKLHKGISEFDASKMTKKEFLEWYTNEFVF